MAALKHLFSSRSSAQTTNTETCDIRMPARTDAVWLEWTQRNVYIRTGTHMDGQDYKHARTKLSHIRTSEISKSVYLYTQLLRLREMCKTLESELYTYRVAFANSNSFADPEISTDMMRFLLSDPGISVANAVTTSPLRVAEIFNAGAGILGLLAIADHSLVD
jgi:hypothetical protein